MDFKLSHTHRLHTLLALLGVCAGLLAVFACNNQGFEYNDYHPNLTIDNSKHLNTTLASSMDPMTPGVFCIISTTIKNGVYYYCFQNNYGDVSESMFNSIDQYMQSQLHMGLNNGLIVGYGNLDNPPHFYAYDLQCPNCFNPNALPLRNHTLTVSGTGIASCKDCHREYNLNTGGNIVAGDTGTMLKPYRASNTGPNGLLHVY